MIHIYVLSMYCSAQCRNSTYCT